MKQRACATAIRAAMLIGVGLSAPPVQAAFIATLMQEGPNVVATGSGTIDLTGLSLFGSAAISAASIIPNLGEIVTGQPGSADLYSSIAGPTSFGSGGETDASTAGEAIVGIFLSKGSPFLAVPSGYVSGGALSDSATWDNATFTSLGVTPGSYVWTWGSGPTADSLTLDIVTAAVPEPSSLALLALPLSFVLLFATRHRWDRAPRLFGQTKRAI